jgi:IS30 family transposase
MNKLNHRSRKTLKFKTPHTAFFAVTLQEAT